MIKKLLITTLGLLQIAAADVLIKYKTDGLGAHTFTVQDGHNWVIQSSTNLLVWEDIDPSIYMDAFVFPNGDGTTDFRIYKQITQREFFRLKITTPQKRDLIEYAHASVMATIQGEDPTNRDLFTSYSSPSTLIRNKSNILHNKIGVTGLVSWNSKTNGKQIGGAAVTPQHVICSAHAPYQIADDLYWVTRDDEVITRKIVDVMSGAFPSTDEGDYVICLLDHPLPPSIEPIEVMPTDLYRYFEDMSISSGGWGKHFTCYSDMTTVLVNQDERVILGELETCMFTKVVDPYPNLFHIGGYSRFISKYRTNIVREEVVPWHTELRAGDSGSLLMVLLGDKLVAVGHMSAYGNGPLFGSQRNQNDLNRMIQIVDADSGIDTGYTLTVTDMSNYHTYREPEPESSQRLYKVTR